MLRHSNTPIVIASHFNVIHYENTKMAVFCSVNISTFFVSKVRDITRDQHCINSVIENGNANLRGTKMAPIEHYLFPGLKTDSAKRFLLTSYSCEGHFIPIHPLGREKAYKTFILATYSQLTIVIFMCFDTVNSGELGTPHYL